MIVNKQISFYYFFTQSLLDMQKHCLNIQFVELSLTSCIISYKLNNGNKLTALDEDLDLERELKSCDCRISKCALTNERH